MFVYLLTYLPILTGLDCLSPVLGCIVLYFSIFYFILLYCIVLYIYIYIALLAVHTNQKCFQCERPKEKRAAVLRGRRGTSLTGWLSLVLTLAISPLALIVPWLWRTLYPSSVPRSGWLSLAPALVFGPLLVRTMWPCRSQRPLPPEGLYSMEQ